MRVGRSALDEDAIRLIEEHNPDVEFDWPRILKGQAEEPAPPRQKERPKRSDSPRDRGPESPRGRGSESSRNREAEAFESPRDREAEASENAEVEEAVLPAAIAEEAFGEAPEAVPVEVESAAHARLGSEALLRLRARYAEVMARISERIQDPARQEQLKAQAERLNPDVWVTSDEVTQGLEEYEAVYAELRSIIGSRTRKRRRRRPRGGQTSETAPAAPGTGDEGEVDDTDGSL